MAEENGGFFSFGGESAGSGLIGGIIDVGTSFAASSKAFKRARQMYRNRYQWAAKDLEKAGLNRILALTKGPGPSAGVISPARTGGLAAAAQGAALLRAQLQQIKATTAKTIAEENLLRARVPAAGAKEEVMQWFFDQVRGLIGDKSKFSAQNLLSPEAKKAFGVKPRKEIPANRYIRIVPKGQKYKGEK